MKIKFKNFEIMFLHQLSAISFTSLSICCHFFSLFFSVYIFVQRQSLYSIPMSNEHVYLVTPTIFFRVLDCKPISETNERSLVSLNQV